MSDWFTLGLQMQRDLLKAQNAQMDAAQKMIDAGKQLHSMQEAGQKAAEANLVAFKQWTSLWGWK